MNAPQPPLSLILAALIVAVGAILLVAASAASLANSWNPCAVIGGLIMLPIPTFLLFELGRAIYPGSSRASRTSSILLFIIGGFVFFILASSTAEAAMDGHFIPIAFAFPFAVVGATCCWAAWLYRRWSQRLAEYESQADESKLQPNWRRRLAIPAASFTCAAALTAYFVLTEPPRCAEHVARDQAPVNVPPGAVDVSYCRGVRGIVAYEFTTTEPEFRLWVEEGIGSTESQAANVALEPINGRYAITRYSSLTDEAPGSEEAVLTDGLYYEWTKEDRGVYAAFDSRTNRAYYYAHFH